MIRRCAASCWGVVLIVPAAALAQLPDPTRPPAAMIVPDSANPSAQPVESGVQTIIVRQQGKSGAVIDGRYVEVGQMIGDRRIVKITESEVVLKGAAGREVLKAMPAIEKLPVPQSVPAKSKTAGTKEK